MANIPKPKRGRKPKEESLAEDQHIELDPDEIRELASEGNTLEDISDVLGVGLHFIDSRPEYKRAYELGMSDMRVSLRHWQFQSAKSGNVTMLIWLGKVLLGQREETQTTIKLDREDDELTKSLIGLAKEVDKAHGKR